MKKKPLTDHQEGKLIMEIRDNPCCRMCIFGTRPIYTGDQLTGLRYDALDYIHSIQADDELYRRNNYLETRLIRCRNCLWENKTRKNFVSGFRGTNEAFESAGIKFY